MTSIILSSREMEGKLKNETREEEHKRAYAGVMKYLSCY